LNIDDVSITNDSQVHKLPNIINVQIRKTIFKKPSLTFIRSRLEKYHNKEVLTISLFFQAPLPIRDSGLILHIGKASITESVSVSPTELKFFVFDEKLQDGEIIHIGWFGDSLKNCINTGFRYYSQN
jgi:hypothetical protein